MQSENDPNTPSNMPNIKGTVKGKKSPDNKQEPAQTRFKWENLGTVFTGLIFFVTFIYALISYCQWRTMKDALAVTDSSNNMTRINIRNQLRAYLKIDTVFDVKNPATKENALAVRLTNFGHTQCNNIIINIDYRLMTLQSKIIIEKTAYGQGKCFISPNNASKYDININLHNISDSTLNKIKHGKNLFPIQAQIIYDTGFDSLDTLRVTLYYSNVTNRWIEGGIGFADINFNEKDEKQY